MKERYPNLRGPLILQDQEVVLNAIPAEDIPGVDKMPHDFFLEQPVKHAKAYILRRVLHDWKDDEAQQILKAIIPAMAPDSRILVGDFVLAERLTANNPGAMALDMLMPTIGGKERTRSDWNILSKSCGLILVNLWRNPEESEVSCVLEFMLLETIIESQIEPTLSVHG